MSLGSGFSSRAAAGRNHVCGGGQFSTVDVNAQRLTSCAGNYDDGSGNNGGLITVGGVGDSTDNPADPNAVRRGRTTSSTTSCRFLTRATAAEDRHGQPVE